MTALDPLAERSLAVLRTLFGARLGRDMGARLWDGTAVGDGDERFTLAVNAPFALRAAFTPPLDANPGRAFVEGWLDIAGDTEAALDACERAVANLPKLALARLFTLLARLPSPPRIRDDGAARLHGRRHSRRRDAAAIGFHYDQPVAFYRSFLGSDLVYSCAYWDDGVADLDGAQHAKLDLVLDKLRLRAGQTFLDIGCGWGALVIRAARRGARALGITLSRRQHEEAVRRIAEAGLADRARVELRDYRELGEQRFDAIASVGMVEHVGRERLRKYFASAYRALRDGGLFLNHGIVSQARDGKGYRAGRDFLGRYVFPDGDLPPLDVSLRAAEASGFEVRDIENLREHYARTLRTWVANLRAAHADAVAVTDERTERIWRLYMNASARGFALGRLGLMQTLLAKPRADGTSDVPPTRRDLYR
ncbi:MAG: class I SAM-dependent methyltransferase [Candidatus Eremiobacteraeota bacterium]|nr:class I SAM-dependent methyltransferase [Candidatus Eremiobacteraeota bacterium]